jgi:hypothetical protein
MVNGVQRLGNTGIVNQFIADTPFGHNSKAPYALMSGSGHATAYSLLRNFVATGEKRGHSREIVSFISQEGIDFAVSALLVSFLALMRRAVILLGWGRITLDLLQDAIHETFNDA